MTARHAVAGGSSEVGAECPGHLWRWELEETAPGTTRVTHTYDWTALTDPRRMEERARSTTTDALAASLERLAELAERG